MSEAARPVTVLCNGARPPGKKSAPKNALRLEYQGEHAKVKLLLPDFVRDVYHLPGRVLDLLEIAAYVFAADRSAHRGEKNAVEYHRWSRSMRFVIKVRDHAFWRQQQVQEKLAAALEFMSGDRSYEFAFQPGHSTPATSLFDTEAFAIRPEPGMKIALFSGGLDSLAGVVDALADPTVRPCLISHQSGQPGTIRTQNRLFQALDARYPKRLRHYRFKCGLHGERAEEETQRTRAFLYGSIAFSLAHALKANTVTAYENGVTAINFPKRADLLNARASRTTHPKTVTLLQAFLSEVLGADFRIETPFISKTKADVMTLLAERSGADLITSAVSCSRTFQKLGQAPQCGGCSQCIDRRFAAHAANLHDIDHAGLYAMDFLKEIIEDFSAKTTLVDYVRQAVHFAGWNIDFFQRNLLNELADLAGYSGLSEQETVETVYALCQRHGRQVGLAIRRMRDANDDPFQAVPDGSFLKIIGDREYLGENSFDCTGLCSRLAALPTGNEHANAYEHLVRDAMEAVFHPDLVNGRLQQRTDEGRKRIDVIFNNKAKQGFFASLRDTHHKYCPWVLFECKNYSRDIENPDFAQLRDRLGDGRPEIGIIVCRKNEDKTAVLKQCQDRSRGNQGGIIILVLDDTDLGHLLTLRGQGQLDDVTAYLDDKLQQVLLRT